MVRINANALERAGMSPRTSKNEHEYQNYSTRTAFVLYIRDIVNGACQMLKYMSPIIILAYDNCTNR